MRPACQRIPELPQFRASDSKRLDVTQQDLATLLVGMLHGTFVSKLKIILASELLRLREEALELVFQIVPARPANDVVGRLTKHKKQ